MPPPSHPALPCSLGPGSPTPDEVEKARSRILGRAQARLTWIQKYKGPMCAFLKAEAAA